MDLWEVPSSSIDVDEKEREKNIYQKNDHRWFERTQIICIGLHSYAQQSHKHGPTLSEETIFFGFHFKVFTWMFDGYTRCTLVQLFFGRLDMCIFFYL